VKQSPQSNTRIVLAVPAFPKLSETFIVSKFLGLLERGWDVHLVCRQSNPKDWEAFPELHHSGGDIKQRVHVSWPHRPRWLAFLLFVPAMIRALICAPKRFLKYLRIGCKRFGFKVFRTFYLDLDLVCLKPDIIHFEFGALAVGRMHLKDLLDCKTTVSFRGYDLNFAGLDQPDYYTEVWKGADACHFLGQDLFRRAQQRGCPADIPHSIIPPAINLEKFPTPERTIGEILGTKEHPLKVLSVGRLEWKKGYEFALSALKLLQDQGCNFEYRVIGEGEHRAAIEFASYQLGINGRVCFLGAVPHDQVIRHLQWADIFLHPSVSEGFCNAVIEAQAVGLPVVCTDADGLPENVADGITGFVVPRRDSIKLAEKLTLLISDPNLRLTLGEAGRKRVMEKFQLDEQKEAFHNFFVI
jgi:colanic acid/amylovoran biosynthesis glycosyltransferase